MQMISNLSGSTSFVLHASRLQCFPTHFLSRVIYQKVLVVVHKKRVAKSSGNYPNTMHYITAVSHWLLHWYLSIGECSGVTGLDPSPMTFVFSSLSNSCLDYCTGVVPDRLFLPNHSGGDRTIASMGVFHQTPSDRHPLRVSAHCQEYQHVHCTKVAVKYFCSLKERDIFTLKMEAGFPIVSRNEIEDIGRESRHCRKSEWNRPPV